MKNEVAPSEKKPHRALKNCLKRKPLPELFYADIRRAHGYGLVNLV